MYHYHLLPVTIPTTYLNRPDIVFCLINDHIMNFELFKWDTRMNEHSFFTCIEGFSEIRYHICLYLMLSIIKVLISFYDNRICSICFTTLVASH